MVNRVRPNAQSIRQFISYVSTSVHDINRQLRDDQGPDVVDDALFRVDSLIVNLHRVRLELNDDETFHSLSDQLEGIVRVVQTLQPPEEEIEHRGYQVPKSQDGGSGRPKYIILPEQLQYFLGIGFHVTDIADMLGVHRGTIHNRLKEYNLSKGATYSTLSDRELHAHVLEVVQHNRNIGYRGVRSRLDAEGMKVPYHRVRQALLRVDEGAVALRVGNTVHRRTYRVAGPNALWHFDGNHKLITFKFVIHGGIDGFSRMIVWLKVSTNNRAQTVLDAFKEAERKYGLPSRVRCDRGVENGKVVSYMTQKRGADHRPAIVGSSVHNQRIERTWRDVFQGSLCVFYDIFSALVASGALDLTNDVQMYAFHFTFVPIIQRSLNKFTSGFNKHPLVTESCRSPEQLFARGVFDRRRMASTGVTEYWDRAADPEGVFYGVDDDGPVPELERLTSAVNLEDINCPFPEDVVRQLQERFEPCNMCSHDNAIEVYGAVLRFLAGLGY